MAKYVNEFQGDYNDFIKYVKEKVIGGSFSADIEDEQVVEFDQTICTVIVFERYSYVGSNRVSMNLTIIGHGKHIQIIAITAGGSQAIFFKINRVGENEFLHTLIAPVEEYILAHEE